MRFNRRKTVLAWARDGSSRAVAVLLLHGLSGISSGYDEVVDDFGASADVFRLDLRGHGRSDHAPGTYSIPCYTEDVIAFIEEVITKPVMPWGRAGIGPAFLPDHAARQHAVNPEIDIRMIEGAPHGIHSFPGSGERYVEAVRDIIEQAS